MSSNPLRSGYDVWKQNGFQPLLDATMFNDYQLRLSEEAREREKALFAVFMGAGKTAVCLHAFQELKKENPFLKGLIIGPKPVILSTWPNEVGAWRFSLRLTFSVICGTPDQRLAATEADADLMMVNRENLLWLLKTKGRKWFDQFDVMIYDEASRMKAGSFYVKPPKKKPAPVYQPVCRPSGEAKPNLSEFGVLATIRPAFRYIWALTGTPIPNGVIDLWGQMYLIDGGKRLGTKKSHFHTRWFHYNPTNYAYTEKKGASEEIKKLVSDKFLCLNEEDHLTLPPLVTLDTWVDLPPKGRKAYNAMKRELAIPVEDPDKEVVAMNSAVAAGKLLQIANGAVYESFDPEDTSYDPRRRPEAIPLHREKLDALHKIIDDTDQPVLVFYSYKFDVHSILEEFPQARYFSGSPQDTDDWNAGRIPLMVAHPASAGHGMNFQHGSNVMVWFGLPFSLELYDQAIKRLHRRGQSGDRVLMYRILARNTYDARVAQVLETRGAVQDDFKQALKMEISA